MWKTTVYINSILWVIDVWGWYIVRMGFCFGVDFGVFCSCKTNVVLEQLFVGDLKTLFHAKQMLFWNNSNYSCKEFVPAARYQVIFRFVEF